MVALNTPLGQAIIDDETITRIIPPYAKGDPYTHVYGPALAVIEVVDGAAQLVAALRLRFPLVQLMTPYGIPVWIKAAAVSMVRPPTPHEAQSGCRSIVIVAGSAQPVREGGSDVIALVNAAGGNLSPAGTGMVPKGMPGVAPESKDPIYVSPDYRPEGEIRPW